MIWIKDFTFRSASYFFIFFAVWFCKVLAVFFAISSRASASCSTSTSGALPDKNTACSFSSNLCHSFAIFMPAKVLPAPGTPVIKQIDFLQRVFECSMISLILAVVRLIL